MSLYRDYRPRSFEDIAGQQHVVSTLKQAVEQDQLAHAYLFAGTRGTGKTSTARILGSVLLTRGIEDETRVKQIKEALEQDSLVDLTEIDAASNRGIDDIRQLIEKIQFTPAVAAAKVFIIDEVHMLTKEAFNALLKTLEEPPAHAYFILATTELHKIPATIQSRCQRFLFHAINEEHIVERLRFIADKENITIDDEALHTIALHVQGGLRDAVSLLDQLRSLSTISVQDVRERIGETGHEHATAIRTAMKQQDTATIVQTIRQIEQDGASVEHIARLLLAQIRDELHAAIETKADHQNLAQSLTTILDALKDLRTAPLPSLTLESALLSLCTTPSNNQAPITQAAPPKATTPVPAQAAAPAPASPKPTNPAVQNGELSVESIRQQWNELLDEVNPASVRMSLKNGHVHSLENDTLTLHFASSFHCTKAQDPAGQQALQEALEKRFKKKFTISCTTDANAQPTAASNVDLASAVGDVFHT